MTHTIPKPVAKHGAWYWRRYGAGEKNVWLGRCDAMTERQARAEIERRMLEMNPHAATPGVLLTVRQFVERYYDPLHVAVKMKPAAASSARSLLHKHILPALGHLQLCDMDALAQQQLIAAMVAAGLSRKTVENAWAVLSSMGAFARRKKLGAPRVDRDMVDFPPAGVDAEQRWFTPDEVARIVRGSGFPWRACWALCGHLGIRCGEVLALRWCDVDFTQRIVRLRQNAVNKRVQTLKSKNSRSDLAMSTVLEAELRAYEQWFDAELAQQHSDKLPTSLLFCDDDGLPYSGKQARAALSATLRALDIKHAGLHAFRHALASQMFKDGASAPQVRNQLRHGRITTTMNYTHTLDADQRAMSERVSVSMTTVHKPDTVTGNSPGKSE